jgi:putative ABC transport system permease protein
VIRYGLTRADRDLLASTIPTVAEAIPVRETSQEARYLQRTLAVRLVACTSKYAQANALVAERGRFLTDDDQERIANVAVLGFETARVLFPAEDPVGRLLRVGNHFYTVVGTIRERTPSAAIGGSLAGQDYAKDVYIPLKTFETRVGDLVFNVSSGSFSAERVELDQITLRVAAPDGRPDPATILPTADAVRETLELTHGAVRDWAVVVPLELLRQADQLRLIFNVVLGSIAAISLVVGGIGIMNIMLATVTERTREIGIRRALGARRRDIVEQFLTETVVLSGAGGLIGVLLGLCTPPMFSLMQIFVRRFVLDDRATASELGRIFSQMQPEIAFWSLPVAFGISVGVGIAFGLYPAYAAARMDPIEALRHA